jgi:ketosteroid isomerase-like protein
VKFDAGPGPKDVSDSGVKRPTDPDPQADDPDAELVPEAVGAAEARWIEGPGAAARHPAIAVASSRPSRAVIGCAAVVVDDWAEAIRVKNAEGVVRHHAPDFLHFSLAPPLISTASDAAGLRAWFATWRGGIGYEIQDLKITLGEDTAFSCSLHRISRTKTDGETPDIWFRQTFAFRNIGGAWKIVHEHESVPFYMDGSFKAAVDLKP